MASGWRIVRSQAFPLSSFWWLEVRKNRGERPGRGSLFEKRSLRPYLVVSAPPTGVLNIQSAPSTGVLNNLPHPLEFWTFNQRPLPLVYLCRHWYHPHDKMDQGLPPPWRRRINVCLQTLDLVTPGLSIIHDIATYCGNYLHYSKLGTSGCPYTLWLIYTTYGFCRIFIGSLDYSFIVDTL